MANVLNKYPELPEVPYRKTAVQMAEVVVYLRSLPISIAVQIAVYTIFRNESANGTKGVNENYCGIQADNSRWPEYLSKGATGTTVIKENMTGQYRRFLCFANFKSSIDFLVDRVQARGLFVGGTPKFYYKEKIDDRFEWTVAYYREWVMGNKNVMIPTDEKNYLLKIYEQGKTIFNA